jgi:glycosyltransferase involved in cell wall biosynthesis
VIEVAKSGLKFSVVTISYNQARFLPAAIESVLAQRAAGAVVEYIVCDPGSTDDSRAIIDSYGAAIDCRVFERDNGPADGLNRGFANATGDIFCYLNSDDLFLPGAFAAVARWFEQNPEIDVACGHGVVIDEDGAVLRRVWSEPYGRRAVAFGAHVQIQPSTFIRAAAFRKSGGFDPDDRANWDGDLLVSLYLSGARIAVIDAMLGGYRLHGESITATGKLAEGHARSGARRFARLMGRELRPSDRWTMQVLRLAKHLRWPLRTLERMRRGPLFRRPPR